jgi:hypothetical protein
VTLKAVGFQDQSLKWASLDKEFIPNFGRRVESLPDHSNYIGPCLGFRPLIEY